jgi:hypothetical protein
MAIRERERERERERWWWIKKGWHKNKNVDIKFSEH